MPKKKTKKKIPLEKISRDEIAAQFPVEFQLAFSEGRGQKWLDTKYNELNKVPTVKEIQNVRIQRIYKMDRDVFMAVWIKTMKDGAFGETMLARLKAEFDGQQVEIGGEKPVLTWAKCKAKMSYYKKEWGLSFETIPFGPTVAEVSAEEFKHKWKEKVSSASVGADDRRKAADKT